MTYKVKLDIFEGPLDLLLYLVEKEKINILEVSIVSVVDQFLEYLKAMEEMSLEIAGSFLVMAATLLEIKSRKVLPKLPTENDPEEEENETRLIEQLFQYKQFKEAAKSLLEKERTALFHYMRHHPSHEGPIQVFREVSLFDLLNVMKNISLKIPFQKKFSPARSTANVVALMEKIRYSLTVMPRMLFKEFLLDITGADAIIAAFLAILELVRLKEIIAIQEYLFGEIFLIQSDTLILANDQLLAG